MWGGGGGGRGDWDRGSTRYCLWGKGSCGLIAVFVPYGRTVVIVIVTLYCNCNIVELQYCMLCHKWVTIIVFFSLFRHKISITLVSKLQSNPIILNCNCNIVL